MLIILVAEAKHATCTWICNDAFSCINRTYPNTVASEHCNFNRAETDFYFATYVKDQHVGHVAGLITAAVTGTLPFTLGGTLAGRLIGRLRDDGITNKFLKKLQDEVQPNTSALIVYARSDKERREKVAKRLAVFNPKILESDLPPELEKELNDLNAQQRAATGK